MYSWSARILVLGFVFTIAAAEIDRFEIYQGCGEKSKACFGDVEGCIKTQNCTFVVSAYENATHYSAVIQNTCNVMEKNVFFGVGVYAIQRNATQPVQYVCIPKFKDFKYIILWEGNKCEKHEDIQKRWGYMSKRFVNPCPATQRVTNLLEFVKNDMLVMVGEIPTARIEAKRYVEKIGNHGAIFYTNSAPTSHSLKLSSVILSFTLYKML